MFKVNNKNSRKTSITSWCLIVDFELYSTPSFTPYFTPLNYILHLIELVDVKASQVKA